MPDPTVVTELRFHRTRIFSIFILQYTNIKKLDSKGFLVFVGKGNRKLVGDVGNPEGFPVVLIRLIRKDSEEIVRNEVF